MTDEPHCKHCGNPYVEKTVEVCSWGCLHHWCQEQLARDVARSKLSARRD